MTRNSSIRRLLSGIRRAATPGRYPGPDRFPPCADAEIADGVQRWVIEDKDWDDFVRSSANGGCYGLS
jgi:hypothetical protein